MPTRTIFSRKLPVDGVIAQPSSDSPESGSAFEIKLELDASDPAREAGQKSSGGKRVLTVQVHHRVPPGLRTRPVFTKPRARAAAAAAQLPLPHASVMPARART